MSDASNPKDAAGRAKLPLHLWPASATAYGSLGFLEGECKYGRNNFRGTSVAASVYVAAAMRHITAWFEGEENSADTGNPHLGNALACLAILVDAKVNGTLIDDRNFVPDPGAHGRMIEALVQQSASLKAQFADKKPKHYDARDNKHAQPKSGDTHASTTFDVLKDNVVKAASSFGVEGTTIGQIQRNIPAAIERAQRDVERAKIVAAQDAAGVCHCASCEAKREYDNDYVGFVFLTDPNR